MLGTSVLAVAITFMMLASCAMLGGSATESPVLAVPRRDPPRRVEYVVGLTDARTQTITVSMILRGVPPGELELCLPVWRPGRYQILDMASSITGVAARAGDGKPRNIRKVEKATWNVSIAPGDDEIIIDYRVYANSIGDRTRHADESHAFLSPASVFMYAPSMRQEPLVVRLSMPEGWKIASGLEPDPGDASALLAPDYDILVDSPIEAGFHDLVEFDVDGTPHQIAVWWGGVAPGIEPSRRGRHFDKKKLAEDFTKIIRAERDVFGSFPYKRYVFLVHCYQGGGGGTEHVNSTIVGCPPAAFEDDSRYHGFLTLIAHEFFHTWNVKQLRPAGLKPYDYQRENYTDLLWVAEGATSYYEHVALVRAGLTTPSQFIDVLSSLVESDRKRIGSKVQSAEESSFDAWIKFNRPSPNDANTTVSFYDKGAQLSMVLDLLIRNGSSGTRSLDDVMRELYEKYPLSGLAYSSRDLRELSNKAAGVDLAWFFDRHVARADPIDYESALRAAGLEVSLSDAPARRTIGATFDDADGGARISSIETGSAAAKAGLLVGDVIVAFNDRRVRGGEVSTRMQELAAGATVELTFFRMNVLRRLAITLDEAKGGSWRVRRVENPSPVQKRVFESWTGRAWND
ncbi:MAG: PDZ domain-containing protein [Phycisphaerales bacterium]